MTEQTTKQPSKSFLTRYKYIFITCLIIALLIIFFLFCIIFTYIIVKTENLNPITENKSSNGEIAGVITESIEPEILTYKVLEITDGDTIKILYNEKQEKVRLIGIDTPETEECFNQEATRKMQTLVEGSNVRIEFDTSQGERDKYDRLLLYIWNGDTFINDTMVREGYAHEYTYNLPYKYQSQFKQAEKEAREGKKGLWGDVCACQEGEEIDRKCISCNKAEITRTHWDCSTYKTEINDNSCTLGCYSPPPQPTTPTYICNCSKTCPEMSSCEEAYYQLNTCRCSIRDGDNDGVPCENICPGG